MVWRFQEPSAARQHGAGFMPPATYLPQRPADPYPADCTPMPSASGDGMMPQHHHAMDPAAHLHEQQGHDSQNAARSAAGLQASFQQQRQPLFWPADPLDPAPAPPQHHVVPQLNEPQPKRARRSEQQPTPSTSSGAGPGAAQSLALQVRSVRPLRPASASGLHNRPAGGVHPNRAGGRVLQTCVRAPLARGAASAHQRFSSGVPWQLNALPPAW